MFIFGDDYYGKVDTLPGVFFVKTRFLHIFWLPIVPCESYLLLYQNSDSKGQHGVRIPLRWKSVWLAWLRAFLAISIMVLLALGTRTLPIELQNGKVNPDVVVAIEWIFAIICIWIYWMTQRFSPVKLSRAIELGNLLGLVPADVLTWFEQFQRAKFPEENSRVEESELLDRPRE